MKFIFFFVFGMTAIFLEFIRPAAKDQPEEITRLQILEKKKNGISCSTDWSNFPLTSDDVKNMMPLPGTGSHQWKISTTSDSAQFYFNQGINLYYGFHIIESIPSFKKAQLFDSSCAMLYWGEALAYGPNINDLGYAASPEALQATRKAYTKMQNATALEKSLIEAMTDRYSEDSTQKRDTLNVTYSKAMHEAYTTYGNDAEVAALYADALMLLHPWNLWQHDGKPRPWTNEIVAVLEKILKASPEHPGANHYYIHAIEASPAPWKAKASADRLGNLTPGLSHMVHMPSHIYIRTGDYEKGIRVNQDAVGQYQKYVALYPAVINNAPLYDFHNRHMQAVCSMNGTDYNKALKDAMDCRNSFDTSFLSLPAPIGTFIEYFYMTPEFAMIQFAKWEDILKVKETYTHSYAGLLQQFARGMAYANTGKIDEARKALQTLVRLSADKDLAIPFGPFNAPEAGAAVAREILTATILQKSGKAKQAIAHFESAVTTEAAMIYNEPKDWILPARQFLGYALLASKHYSQAEKVFREDLKEHPNNPTSSKGLKAALNKKQP